MATSFDDSKVPVEVIAAPNPYAAGLDPADFEVIGEKVSHRLEDVSIFLSFSRRG